MTPEPSHPLPSSLATDPTLFALGDRVSFTVPDMFLNEIVATGTVTGILSETYARVRTDGESIFAVPKTELTLLERNGEAQ